MRMIISYIKGEGLIACLCELLSNYSTFLFFFLRLSSRFSFYLKYLLFLIFTVFVILMIPNFPLSFLTSILKSPPFKSPGFLLSSPLFNETVFSYAVVPWPQISQSYLSFMEFEVTFWPSTPNGVLLYSDDADSRDFLAINLVDRFVEFRFDCGSGEAVIR